MQTDKHAIIILVPIAEWRCDAPLLVETKKIQHVHAAFDSYEDMYLK